MTKWFPFFILETIIPTMVSNIEMNEKEKIIHYSKDKFFKKGFYKITMEELAKGMKISKKTIYKYFPSKSDLVESAVLLFQKYVKHKIKIIIAKDENAILKIKDLTIFFSELTLRVDEKMIRDLQTHRQDLWKKIDKFRTELIKEIWVDIINKGKKEGHIVDKPNEIIIAIILSSLRAVINPTFLINHKYSLNEAFEITFDIIVKGLLTPKGLKFYKELEEGN